MRLSALFAAASLFTLTIAAPILSNIALAPDVGARAVLALLSSGDIISELEERGVYVLHEGRSVMEGNGEWHSTALSVRA